jgi:bla regulator protein blaR1
MMSRLLVDHLWQSTVCVALAGLLVLLLRKNHPQVRYWIWLSASLKFLVPFGALSAIGRQVSWPLAAPVMQPQVTIVIDTMSQAFSGPELPLASTLPAAGSGTAWLMAAALVTIWFGGFVTVLLRWWADWRSIAEAARCASPLDHGRVAAALRRLLPVFGFKKSVVLAASNASFEPGVFGIVKPVLLWPESMTDRLDDPHIEAILAHELSHIRRSDNLTAALHMVVEAVFWFHPLVWWLGARLIDEREQACDHEAITHGRDPRVYAESILRTCQFSVEAPLACVAGVTGADLRKRIERIMQGPSSERLGAWKKFLLLAAGIVSVGTPLGLGAVSAVQLKGQSLTSKQIEIRSLRREIEYRIQDIRRSQETAASQAQEFEVASVKRNASGNNFVQLGGDPGGRFTATNVPLKLLIRQAYQLQDSQVVGGPNWINTDRFDIIAKAPGQLQLPAPGGPPGPFQLMLRALLADRFKLAVHTESREVPIYSLSLARRDAKTGSQLRPAAVDCVAMFAARGRGGPPPAPPQPGERPPCGMRLGPGNLSGGGVTMAQLSTTLSQFVQRVVVDRTGLTGNFDIDLTWTPDQLPQGRGEPPPGVQLPPIDPNGPSIFTAVQEQLGLKLDSQRGSVDVLVIDRVEQPTED